MIRDQDVVTALAGLGVREADSVWAYEVDEILHAPGELDVRIHQLSGQSARVRLALPSSGRGQPWIYVVPLDAADWVQQLATWLDEEVLTGGLDWADRIESGRYVVAELYGWRRADPAEHARLGEGWRQLAEPRHRLNTRLWRRQKSANPRRAR